MPLTHLIQIWDAVHIPLLTLFSDHVERCRDLAVRCVLSLIDVVPNISDALHLVLPTLVHRIGSSPPPEPSEEVRLLLLLILSRLVALAPKAVGQYMEGVHAILETALSDAYPLVLQEACGCLVLLAADHKSKLRVSARPPAAPARHKPLIVSAVWLCVWRL